MSHDRIVREITIQAPIDRVWAVITRPEHVGRWFGDAGAEIDLRPGGRILFRWSRYGDSLATVERVEPPHHFSYRWTRSDTEPPRPGTETLVEFTLMADGSGTRLRVVESGFETLDLPEAARVRYVEENRGGWKSELDELAAYVLERVSA